MMLTRPEMAERKSGALNLLPSFITLPCTACFSLFQLSLYLFFGSQMPSLILMLYPNGFLLYWVKGSAHWQFPYNGNHFPETDTLAFAFPVTGTLPGDKLVALP